jgi:hypothetical protein
VVLVTNSSAIWALNVTASVDVDRIFIPVEEEFIAVAEKVSVFCPTNVKSISVEILEVGVTLGVDAVVELAFA